MVYLVANTTQFRTFVPLTSFTDFETDTWHKTYNKPYRLYLQYKQKEYTSDELFVASLDIFKTGVSDILN